MILRVVQLKQRARVIAHFSRDDPCDNWCVGHDRDPRPRIETVADVRAEQDAEPNTALEGRHLDGDSSVCSIEHLFVRKLVVDRFKPTHKPLL